jgi:hypothetical protein
VSAPGDKLFRVIVLGGLALVSHEACGGQTSSDAGSDATEDFPSELPTYVDVGVQDTGTTDAPEEFPSELPSQIDSGSDG